MRTWFITIILPLVHVNHLPHVTEEPLEQLGRGRGAEVVTQLRHKVDAVLNLLVSDTELLFCGRLCPLPESFKGS